MGFSGALHLLQLEGFFGEVLKIVIFNVEYITL